MTKIILKLVTIVTQAVVYFLMTTSLHEQFHMIAANNLGVPGHVLFRLSWGFFVYENPQMLTTLQDVIIGLAGGFGVAAVFGILWTIQHWQGHDSENELDTAAIFAIIVIFQFFYAISEGIELWAPWLGVYAQLVGILCGVFIMFKLYGARLAKWIE